MDSVVEIEFVYDGSLLAPEKYETAPEIMWWTSNDRQWSEVIPIKFKKNSNESISHTVSVPINKIEKLRQDDTIRFECIVQSPNHEGKLVSAKAGTNYIHLLDIYSKISQGKTFNREIPLMMPTFHKGKLQKGTLKVNCTVPNGRPKNWKFSNIEAFHFIGKENLMRIGKTLGLYVARSVYVFDRDMAERFGHYIEPSKEEARSMHAPFWKNEVGFLPTLFFAVDQTRHKKDERFFANLLDLALKRNNMNRTEFVSYSDKQFKDKKGKTISRDFMKVLNVTMDLMMICAVSMRYISDKTYTETRETGPLLFRKHKKSVAQGSSGEEEEEEEEEEEWGDGGRVGIESFHDALRLTGGDCEDLARLIFYVCTVIETGREDLADKNDPVAVFGSWEDEILRIMQKIAHMYVPTLNLGVVTSKYLGEESAKNKAIIIDSEEDDMTEKGGHMWFEWIPLIKFEDFLNRFSNDRFELYPKEPKESWSHSLPHLIGEGTGYMSPFLKPVTEYEYTTEEEKKEAVSSHTNKISLLKELVAESKILKKGQIQKVQTMVQDVPNSRLSRFYRTSVHCITDKFMREGYNFGDFTWIKGIKHSRKNVVYGVAMRDKLFDTGDVGLLITPGYTKNELQCVQTILRQMPPWEKFEYYTPPIELAKTMEQRIESLKMDVDSITKGRMAGKNNSNVNIIFKMDDILEKWGKFVDLIKADLIKLKGIYRVEIKPEYILKKVNNLRFSIYSSVKTIPIETETHRISSYFPHFDEEIRKDFELKLRSCLFDE